MENKKQQAKIGNQNAAKPPEDKNDGHIHARCKKSDKGLWVAAAMANKMKLTEWIIATLNAAVKK